MSLDASQVKERMRPLWRALVVSTCLRSSISASWLVSSMILITLTFLVHLPWRGCWCLYMCFKCRCVVMPVAHPSKATWRQNVAFVILLHLATFSLFRIVKFKRKPQMWLLASLTTAAWIPNIPSVSGSSASWKRTGIFSNQPGSIIHFSGLHLCGHAPLWLWVRFRWWTWFLIKCQLQLKLCVSDTPGNDAAAVITAVTHTVWLQQDLSCHVTRTDCSDSGHAVPFLFYFWL